MPSRNKEAFEWIKKARELWPPDINKILECYKKAEEISPDYYLIYKDKARLFHGLERFDEAVANYDLEIKKQRERYKNTGTEKFETDEEREEFERGQVVMEEMFEKMKQIRDEAAQKLNIVTEYPWEDQIAYFFFMDSEEIGDSATAIACESELEKSLLMIIQNAGKNCLEKIGHARKYYHAIAANHHTLLDEIFDEMFEELKPVMNKTMERFADATNFEKAYIDDSYSINDEDALNVLYSLIEKEGLNLGTSSGINIAGAIKLGKELGPGNMIITVLCDKSDRYQSKLFNKRFLKEKNLPIPKWL